MKASLSILFMVFFLGTTSCPSLAQDSLNVSLIKRQLLNQPIADGFTIHDGLIYSPYEGVGFDWPRAAITILDVRNPTLPQQLGYKVLNTVGIGNIVIADHIAVMVSTDTMAIIDVSNPANMETLSLTPVSSASTAIAIADTLLYLAGIDSILTVYNLADAAHPSRICTFDLGNRIPEIVAIERHVILAGVNCRFLLLDQNGSLRTTATIDREAVSISANNGLLAIGSGENGAHLYDIQNIDNPRYLTSIEGKALDVTLWSDRLMMGWNFDEEIVPPGMEVFFTTVNVYNVTNPNAPTYQGNLVYPEHNRVTYHTDDDFLISGTTDIYSNPATFARTSLKQMSGCSELFTHSGQQFVGAFHKLARISVSDDLTVRLSSLLSSYNIGLYYAPYGNYIYSCGYTDGGGSSDISVIDISNRDSLKIAGLWFIRYNGKTYYPTDNAVVKGSKLYIDSPDSLLFIYDCSRTPLNPNLLGVAHLPGAPTRWAKAKSMLIEPDRDVAWIASSQQGLIGIDVSNPERPEVISTNRFSVGASCIALKDHFVYVGFETNRDKALQIYDIADPREPVLVDSLLDYQTVYSLSIFGEYCFLYGIKVVGGQHIRGLFVLNLSDHLNSVEVGYYWAGQNPDWNFYMLLPHTYEIISQKLFTAETSQIGIYDISQALSAPIDSPALPPSVITLYVFPNPFNSKTMISFDLDQTSLMDVGVFDIAGRRIATLANGQFEAGQHRLVWNAEAVPTGIYFVKAVSSSGIRTSRMALVR